MLLLRRYHVIVVRLLDCVDDDGDQDEDDKAFCFDQLDAKLADFAPPTFASLCLRLSQLHYTIHTLHIAELSGNNYYVH